MLKVVTKAHKQTVADLEEGDIAVIEYDNEEIMVYVYRDISGLAMVSLSHGFLHWGAPTKSISPVIRVLQPGDLLEVV